MHLFFLSTTLQKACSKETARIVDFVGRHFGRLFHVAAAALALSLLPGLEGQLVLLELVAPVRVDLLVVGSLVGRAAPVK